MYNSKKKKKKKFHSLQYFYTYIHITKMSTKIIKEIEYEPLLPIEFIRPLETSK